MADWRRVMNYLVSDEGVIESARGRPIRSHDLGGYRRVALFLPGEPRGRVCHYMVHRLVALAFLGPCPDGYNVNHKNGDKADNRLANLEYVTFSENSKHALDVLGRPVARGERHGLAVFTESTVREMRAMWSAGAVKTKRDLVAMFGGTESSIGRVLNRRTWTHV